MKLCLILLTTLLFGCTTVPVKREFPTVPERLLTACGPLNLIPETKKMSDVLTVVTDNYSLYHQCGLKVELWIKWYSDQKTIFETVN